MNTEKWIPDVADSRQRGRTKLVYDKTQQAIVTESTVKEPTEETFWEGFCAGIEIVVVVLAVIIALCHLGGNPVFIFS